MLLCVQVAEALLGATVQPGTCAARIMLFVGGPCTDGAGKVINRDLTEEIRSHKDLAKDAAPHFRKAKKFYDTLAQEMVAHGHIMDIFACALDQVGCWQEGGAHWCCGNTTLCACLHEPSCVCAVATSKAVSRLVCFFQGQHVTVCCVL